MRINILHAILIISIALAFVGCAAPPAPTPTPTLTPTATAISTSTPDEATYKIYLSDIGLGILPAGGKLPYDLQKNISVFSSEDQICLYGTLVQEARMFSAIYDPNAKKFVTEKMGPPGPRTKGGFIEYNVAYKLPAGKYEYKVYVGDVLVASLPFEVR